MHTHEEEMEMPTPCQHCGEWFDLNDGCGSVSWYPGTVICETCYKVEDKEMELSDDIENCRNAISDAEYMLKEQGEELVKLLQKQKEIDGQKEERRG